MMAMMTATTKITTDAERTPIIAGDNELEWLLSGVPAWEGMHAWVNKG